MPYKWNLAASAELCQYKAYGVKQIRNHLVDECPVTKYDDGLLLLHEAEENPVNWLKTRATKTLAK